VRNDSPAWVSSVVVADHTLRPDRLVHPSRESDADRYAESRWVQQWGGRRQDITVGDVIWTEPGVKHGHGGTAATAMTHIAIQGLVDRTPVDWMEHVTDEQYLQQTERRRPLT
jgi:hypothetical protein